MTRIVAAIVGTFAIVPVMLAPESHASNEIVVHDGGRSFVATVCDYEDGNTDGSPCVWVDEPTGMAYYVDSENYR